MAKAPNPKRPRIDDSLDFIEKPSEDFHCPVTLEVLTEPHQTLCCGNHLSQEAAYRLKQEGKPCPICNQPNLNTVHDKFFKRKVNQLKVRCSQKALGCDWVGELANLERHLSVGSVDGECKFVTVACPLSCGDHVQRCQLEGHKSKECPQRPCTCEHCGHKTTYKSVTEDHWPRCEKYPLQCPNNCRENTIKRRHLQKHVEKNCPFQVIPCEFAYAGCKAKLKRQLMPAHLRENVESHLSMTSEVSKQVLPLLLCKVEQQQQIAALTSQVQLLTSALKSGTLTTQQATPVSPVFIPPPVFVMTDFEKHKNDDDTWYSPPFYSHIGGYKLCISVDANGWDDGMGTHMGVAVHMMRGEYDDNLKWPFKGEVKVQLLNQRGDKEHIEKALSDRNNFARVVGCERSENAWGYSQFVAHNDLAYNPAKNCQYLMNDCLKFRITKVELAP